MNNKDITILESIAMKMYEQRAESDIYRSGEELEPDDPSPMVYQVPASEFLKAARTVGVDWLSDIYHKDNIDNIIQNGLDEAGIMTIAGWDPAQGVKSITLEDAVEMFKNFFSLDMATVLDPQLAQIVALGEEVIIKVNNEDGEDIEIVDYEY